MFSSRALNYGLSLPLSSALTFRFSVIIQEQDHDVIMCREVLVSEPFNFKPRSPDRGKVWEKIAQELNAIEKPKFRVTARSVRDRYSLLITKHAQKLREGEKVSGIEVETSELDILLEEITEREKNAKAKIESQDLDKNKKAEKEKATVEEVRKQAMERMADIKKREHSSDESGKKKVRRSTNDAIDRYLKQKSTKDHDLKEKELDLRKRELELAGDRQAQAAEQQQTMMKALMSQMQEQAQQQQSLQAMLVEQQQQQNKILMALLENKKA